MRRTTPAAAFLTVALLLAGCGTSGGDASSGGSDGGSGGDPTPVTLAQLEEILPTAADIGPDYVVEADDDSEPDATTDTDAADPTDESDDSMDAAMEEACPEAAQIDWGDDGADDGEEADVTFTTEDGRGVEVILTPDAAITEDQVDTIVDALASCSQIEIEEDGVAMTMDLSAEKTDDLGDYGMRIAYSFAFELFGMPFEMAVVGNAFVVDGVGISVMATSGMDEEAMELVPADEDLVDPLSEEMLTRVQALTD